MKRIVIVKTGKTLPNIAKQRGDFTRWITDGMGLSTEELHEVDVVTGEPLVDPANLAGVVITGSSAMVTDRADWSEHTATWLREVVHADVPVLGICYGHQLLAHALGGTVARNPRGREIGTIRVTLNEEGRAQLLFEALANPFWIQATHRESVVELPEGAQLLASSALDPHQAFRVRNAWGVQFHPEMDAHIIRGYIEGRRNLLTEEGMDPDWLLQQVTEDDSGTTLLRNFARMLRAI